MDRVAMGMLHHVELWVPDLTRSQQSWGWLLGELGYELFQQWPEGQSWRSGGTYLVFEQSPDRIGHRHDRCRPGLNHVAFHTASRAQVDRLVELAPAHGWRLLFAERHPYAGGPHHYAAFLENRDGYEVELVAPPEPDIPGGHPAPPEAPDAAPVPARADDLAAAEPPAPAEAAGPAGEPTAPQ